MKQIAIIAFNDLKFCPYANFYTELFKINNIDFDVFSLSRSKTSSDDDFSIRWKGGKSKIFKLYNFLRYKRFLKKKIVNYDYVVVLTTIPAVLLCNFLLKRFKYKYIVDIRDYTYDNNTIFRFFEKKVLKFSLLNLISSKDFKHFLPREVDYKIIHNCNFSSYKKHNKPALNLRKIVIGYVGSINYFEQVSSFCKLFANDINVEIHFYGNDLTGKMLIFLKKLSANNIFFHGEYSPNEKNKILESIDVLYNAYGNDSTLVKYAISNKFYDFLLYAKPLIVSEGTTMQSISAPFSFVFHPENTNCVKDFLLWYRSIDLNDFSNFIIEKINNIIQQNRIIQQTLIEKIKKV